MQLIRSYELAVVAPKTNHQKRSRNDEKESKKSSKKILFEFANSLTLSQTFQRRKNLALHSNPKQKKFQQNKKYPIFFNRCLQTKKGDQFNIFLISRKTLTRNAGTLNENVIHDFEKYVSACLDIGAQTAVMDQKQALPTAI